ncbi:CU044_2847 family protein [Streptomyces sp. NPDC059850]|uniref:CU044_2847 family protein n=1 Tax=Streptomyces sp. NPDC059850 TaxID=3346970 RepID=UPI00364E2A1D
MTEHREIPLADGTSVRLEIAPVGDAVLADAHGSVGGVGGVGGVTPVGRGTRAAAALADAGLGVVLRGLGSVLQDVHDAVRSAPQPPQEFTVQFGVQVGQDLKLGIVGTNGHASLTISATWRLEEQGPPDERPPDQPPPPDEPPPDQPTPPQQPPSPDPAV